jgi:hypothetical protein
MTGWWENTQYRAGVAVMGVATVSIATVLAVVAVVNPSDGPSWWVVVFAPLVLLLVMVAVVSLVSQPWRYAADITAMRSGEAWVHWTYDEAAWRAANRYDERRNALWIRVALTVMAVGGLMLLIGVPGGLRTVGVSSFGGSLVFIAATFLVLLTLGDPGWVARRAARGEIYVSRRGIYRRPGGYTPLDLRYRTRYESADLVDRPTPHIHIETSFNTGSGVVWTRRTLTDVGVPPGREDEARTLVDLLRRHVLTSPPARPDPHKWAPARLCVTAPTTTRATLAELADRPRKVGLNNA